MDIVEPVLKSVESTGGGWPVLVLVLVIGVIAYLAKYVLDKQATMNEERIAERKQEFDVQLERERNNAANYQSTTNRMVEAFDKNSAAMSGFSSILNAMGETLTRIDKHLDREDYSQRNKERQ